MRGIGRGSKRDHSPYLFRANGRESLCGHFKVSRNHGDRLAVETLADEGIGILRLLLLCNTWGTYVWFQVFVPIFKKFVLIHNIVWIALDLQQSSVRVKI